MPKDLSELEVRIVRKDEVGKGRPNNRTKPLVVREFAKKFIDPETQQPIQVGEAIEVGPYETKEEGTNWFKYYLPDTYKELQWGAEKNKAGKLKSPVAVVPLPSRDGKYYFWIVRVTE